MLVAFQEEDSGRHLPGGNGDGERRQQDTSLVLVAFQEDSGRHLPGGIMTMKEDDSRI